MSIIKLPRLTVAIYFIKLRALNCRPVSTFIIKSLKIIEFARGQYWLLRLLRGTNRDTARMVGARGPTSTFRLRLIVLSCLVIDDINWNFSNTVNLRVLHNFNGMISNLNSSIDTKIWTPDLPNTKQENYSLDRDVRYKMIMGITGMRTDPVKSMIQQSAINGGIL